MATGTAGNDTLSNTDASNYGLDGNDTVFSTRAAAYAYLEGGNGNDYVAYSWSTNPFGEIYGGSGSDLIQGAAFADALYGGRDSDYIEGGSSFGPTGNDYIDGGEGGDALYGYDGDDTILGGEGNDLNVTVSFTYGVSGSTASITGGLYGGAGADFIDGGRGDDFIDGGDDNDVLVGSAGTDQIMGGNGHDIIADWDGVLWANGGEGNDQIEAGASNDHLYGGAGHDWMRGNDGVDELIGQDGNDNLIGGRGSDWMSGGAGYDAFIFESTADFGDHVTDFEVFSDKFVFDAKSLNGSFGAGSGLINGINLVNGSAPVAATSTFFYTGGALFYDSDGTGAGTADLVAAIHNNPPVLYDWNFMFF